MSKLNNIMKKFVIQFFIFISLLMIIKVTFAATAYVDRNNIALNETFTLVITIENAAFASSPDLTPLQEDFNVLGTTHDSSFIFGTGGSSRKVEWQTILAPKKEGTFLIPSLQVGKEKTNPLTIIVTSEPMVDAPNKGDFFIEAKIDDADSYVQQQLLYTMRIFTSKDFRYRAFSHIGSESFKDDRVTVLKAEDEKRYRAQIGNINYLVIEYKLLLFPQQAGKIILPAPRIDAIVSERRGYSTRRQKQISISGEDIELDVKPIPQSYNSNWWLPAKNFSLSQQWSADLKQVKVGEPITRTVIMMAQGIRRAEQLPELPQLDLDNAKVYPDKVERKTSFNRKDIIGKSVNKLLIIPGKAGEMVIPETKITWWDVEQNKQREAVLPAQTLTVQAAHGSSVNSVGKSVSDKDAISENTSQQLDMPAAKSASQSEEQSTQPAVNNKIEEGKEQGRWYIELPLLLVILLVASGWIVDHFRLKRMLNQPENEEDNDRKTGQEKKLRKQLKQACSSAAPKEVRQLLLEWGKLVIADKSPVTLLDIAQYYNGKDILNEINRLENVIYGAGESTWSGANLWNSLEKAIDNNQSAKRRVNNKLERLHKI